MDVFAGRLESTAFSHVFHLGLIYLPHACDTFTVYFLLGGGGGVLSYGLTSHPLSRTSARTRPLRRPRVAPYTFLPVRATNPLRLRFTLSPYLIPLNPQLPPWLLTEHDSLWIALVINNSPAVRSASPAAGHPRVPHWCVREATRCFSPLAFSFLGGGGCCGGRAIRTFHLLVTATGIDVPSDASPHAGFLPPVSPQLSPRADEQVGGKGPPRFLSRTK